LINLVVCDQRKITMNQLFLSKSDFKIARTCPTKLYYKKMGYPSQAEDNEYLALLAEGGYMVGKMAQLYYPDGILIDNEQGTKEALELTKKYLLQDKVTLFEAAIEHDHKIIRVDILHKQENSVNLVEVKSKSYDSKDTGCFYTQAGGIVAKWQEYLEDVTFQYLVMTKAYPKLNIKPFLMMPDKAVNTSIEGQLGWFSLKKKGASQTGFKHIDVAFSGDAQTIREDGLLIEVDVSEPVSDLLDSVSLHAERFLKSLKPGLKKLPAQLTKKCKKCEFRSNQPQKNGFHECFGPLAEVKPHVFDLFNMGVVGGKKHPYVNTMLEQGKASMFDIPADLIKGKLGVRQNIQLKYTKENCEWIDPKLADIILSWKYPLHFIDFETSTMALPYHKGMRPYEVIAFQWSCHTIEEPGADPIHREWVNTQEVFPNFEFATTLMETIGIDGTVFMWATHENTTLKNIFTQICKYQQDNPDLETWIALKTKLNKHQDYRMVNMDQLTKEHYFHPDMKGRTSLKVTLPAVWNNNPYLHNISYLKPYVGYNAEGQILEPYKTLEHIDIFDQSEVIKEGTGAMRAYQEMLYGLRAHEPDVREKWTKLLLQYCELDTMAMVIVYLHWCRLLGITTILTR
jgi:hypothetical protein